ncbi:MAG: crossover junction endodeoxyribonuclease RuvC, partial [Pseudomonadota bacterium]|nr:crossover junction endodeoxyribonuclease RuvC [Pseudomonadota bacterium]
MRILGIDPGIRNTGWGVVTLDGTRLVHLANGVIQPDPKAADAARLSTIA